MDMYTKHHLQMNSTENQLEQKIEEVKKDITVFREETKVSLATITNDLTWLKWLFGIFSTVLTLLLSLLITVLFKLVN